jgi:uncharacterized membrane protein (DUF2068 family)
MKTKRPNILIVTSLLLILSTLLIWGITLVKIREGDPGLAILVSLGVIFGVLGLVAAAGVFVVKRWGMWLAVVVSAFAIFFAIGGVVLWDALLKGLCVVLAALYVLVIVLAVLPSTRQSYVTERVREAP